MIMLANLILTCVTIMYIGKITSWQEILFLVLLFASSEKRPSNLKPI